MKKDNIGKHVLLVLLALIVALLPCELALRLFFQDQYPTFSYLEKHKRFVVNGRESSDSGMFASSDYYAFALRPHLQAVITDRKYGFTQKVSTNGEGFRIPGGPGGADKIMVLGDSVTFGVGVDDGQSYPDRLQALLGGNCQVLNYGVGNWGFAEYYLTYKKYAPQVQPRLVILGVFPDNDFYDLRAASWPGKGEGALPRPPLARKDVFMDGEGRLRNMEWTYRVPVLRNLASFVFLNRVLLIRLISWKDRQADRWNPLSTEALSLKIIEDLSRDQPLLVLLLPARHNYGDFKFLRVVENYQTKVQGIKGVHLLNFFPLVKGRADKLYVDGSHFNQEGNRLVAQEIYGFITQHHLLPGDKSPRSPGDDL